MRKIMLNVINHQVGVINNIIEMVLCRRWASKQLLPVIKLDREMYYLEVRFWERLNLRQFLISYTGVRRTLNPPRAIIYSSIKEICFQKKSVGTFFCIHSCIDNILKCSQDVFLSACEYTYNFQIGESKQENAGIFSFSSFKIWFHDWIPILIYCLDSHIC